MKSWINIKSICGTILLAIVGSALYENLFRDFFSFIGRGLLTISTLGIEKLKDDIYLEIAKGFYENVSIQVLGIIFSVLFGIIFGMLFAMLRADKEDGIKESKIRIWLRVNRNKVKIFFLFYTFLVFGISILSVSKISYINKSISYYNQLLKIASPYLTTDQEKGINASFAEIQNKSDYVSLVEGIEQIIKSNNQRLPKPPSFIF